MVPTHPFPLPVEQTLYESLHTAVEGFPQAVAVDAEVVQCAKQAHSAELARVNQTSANVTYWQLTVVPTDAIKLFASYGMSKEDAEAAVGRVTGKWLAYVRLFALDEEDLPEDAPMDISISGSARLTQILQFNQSARNRDPRGPETPSKPARRHSWVS